MSTHVDVLVAGALQAQLVGVAAGRTTVHLQTIVSIAVGKGEQHGSAGGGGRWAGRGGLEAGGRPGGRGSLVVSI